MDIYKSLIKNKEILDLQITEETEKEKLDWLSTGVIMLNLLFSGKVDGGIPIGKISEMPAPPSLGKSFVALSLVKNAQKKGMFPVVVDTEGAFDFEWAKNIGIDVSEGKILVIQENMIESIQKALMKMSKSLAPEEKRSLFVVIDSWGNLVTDKTISDAEAGKDVKDMTVTTKKNTLARLLLTMKSTVFIANHTYANIGGYGDPTSIPGGQVLYHNCTSVIVAKSKAKDTDSQNNLTGQLVSCLVWKTRGGKEKMTGKFRIKHNGGLDIFYGILEDAIEHGCVVKPSNGFFTRPHIKDDKKFRESQIYTSEFWLPLFKETDFKDWIEKKYSFKGRKLDISDFEIQEELNKDE